MPFTNKILCSLGRCALACALGSASPLVRGALLERLERGESLKVAAIGTSLTNPVSSDWVRQLGVWLNGRYPGHVTLCNEGVGGSASKYTSSYTLAAYPGKKSGVDYQLGQALACDPDVLFIEFSYNDAYTPYGISVAMANANLQEMINTARNWATAAGKPLDIVVQTMNIDPKPIGTSARPYYPDYYQGYREIAASNSVLLVDNYPAWLALYSSKRTVYDGFMSDEYHPNAWGNACMTLPKVRAALVGQVAGPAATIDRALVAHWRCDDASGTLALDAAGSGAGSVSSSGWSSGLLGGCLALTGAGSARVLQDSALNPTSITLSAWVKTSDTGNTRGLVDKTTGTPANSGYWLDIGTAGYPGRPRFGIRNAAGVTVTVTDPVSVADGAWHLITGSFANTGTVKTVALYVDGLLKSTTTTTSSILADTTDLHIGGDGASTLRLTGALDDVALWNRALSVVEVKAVNNLARHATLAYDAGHANRLFNLYHDGGGSIHIKGSVWRFVASGLSGVVGEVQVRGDGTYAINLANGSGVCTGPERVTVISLAMNTKELALDAVGQEAAP